MGGREKGKGYHKLSTETSFFDGSAAFRFAWVHLDATSESCLKSCFGGGLNMSLVENGLPKSWDGKASLKKSPLKALPLRMFSCGSR